MKQQAGQCRSSAHTRHTKTIDWPPSSDSLTAQTRAGESMAYAPEAADPGGVPPATASAPRYAWYVLFILFLVYVLNFVDRQIISILAEDIKRDLGLRDEDLGFLYGTAFGVFYSLFGIPLGRLADHWHR